VPVVFTHHTLYEEYTHYVPFDSTALKQFTVDLSTHYANLCDGVIAPSESIAHLIKERGVLTPVKVIPTGIDLELFSSGDGKKFRKDQGIDSGKFVVGHVGRLAPEKNLQFLCQSLCHFLKDSPQALFLVVGGGPCEEIIRKIFEDQGLTGQLLMVGKKTGRDLYDAYRGMNMFAFSSFSETQGMVLAEAMAAGLPVVALDASGVREVVRHDKNGFLLLSDATSEDFSKHLKMLATDPGLRKRFKEGARRTAQKFSRERSAEAAVEFYEEIRMRTRQGRREEREDIWAALGKRLEVEWALISEKAKCAFNALAATDQKGDDE
ncbi:MAG: glycosyl transferase group 1, partial [Verrucomicrobiales bacterium]|nr:glycosyl transferase group 1 [Verrucomicrobiales bacterium]